MKKTKHLLLWSSLGTLALLVAAAVEENFLKEWQRVQRSAASEGMPVDIRLRQIVVPGLHAVDRCVSCHVGMAPGEELLRGAGAAPIAAPMRRGAPPTREELAPGAIAVALHPPAVHEPAEFGCTVCHGGQGRATEKADAHGDVPFWPEPMIPLRYAYAGCGTCHTHLHVPDRMRLAAGEALFERYDCLACHRVDGRGGTLRPDGGGMEGPDLSRVGAAGYDRKWYAKHLERALAGADGPWKASFGPLEENELEAIEVYLSCRIGAPRLLEAKALFHSLGCRGCHQIGGVGGDDGPDLTRVGEKDPGRLDFRRVPREPTLANWFAEHLRHPARIVEESQMPILGLSEEEIDLLTFYILSLRRQDFPESYWPRDRVRAERLGEREFAADGATLFGTFCAACHGPRGEGRRYLGTPPFPAVGNEDFLRAAGDEFIAETVRRGRPGRRMPAWGEKQGGRRSPRRRSKRSWLSCGPGTTRHHET